MGMPLEFNTMIVTKNNEKQLHSNLFELVKQGYRIYPLDIPIDVRVTREDDISGTAILHKLIWENEQTVIIYELLEPNIMH